MKLGQHKGGRPNRSAMAGAAESLARPMVPQSRERACPRGVMCRLLSSVVHLSYVDIPHCHQSTWPSSGWVRHSQGHFKRRAT
jgi:hypothetical protein